MADVPPTTGYEPRILQKTKIYVSSRCSSTDRVQLRLTILLRAYAPPESDLDDEQIRALLASPLYLQEREASAD